VGKYKGNPNQILFPDCAINLPILFLTLAELLPSLSFEKEQSYYQKSVTQSRIIPFENEPANAQQNR